MLRINLLPPERRKLRRTPLYALVPLILGVTLLTGATAITIYFYFKKLDLDQQIEQAQAEEQSLRWVNAEFGRLTGEKGRIQREIGSVMKIVTGKKLDWSEILEGLVEVSSKNPAIWFEKVEVQQGARAMSTYTRYNPGKRSKQASHAIKLECGAAPAKTVKDGKDLYEPAPNRIFKFRQDLKSHHLLGKRFREILPINPDWKLRPHTSAAEGFYLKFDIFLVAVN